MTGRFQEFAFFNAILWTKLKKAQKIKRLQTKTPPCGGGPWVIRDTNILNKKRIGK